jgi:ABC-type transport system substrate-binding protein
MKRALALALLGTLGVSVAARAAFGPCYGGSATVALPFVPQATSPGVGASSVERLVLGLVHATLVEVAADGSVRPALARSWSSAALGREWTLELDPAARFHDDAPVTAAHAVRSIRRFLAGGTSAARRLARALEPGGVGADEAGRVVLRFRDPTGRPLLPLASLACAITGTRGVAAGPFIPTLAIPGSRLAFTAFGGYWRGRAFLDGLTAVAVPDDGRRHAELAAGRVDLAMGEPGVQAPATTLLLVLNPQQPPFDRESAREAVAAAMDRVALAREYIPGGVPTLSALSPSLGGPPGPIPAGRGSSARRLAGAITLAVATDVAPAISQRIVAHLDALGLRVTATPVDPSAARGAAAEARLFLFAPEVADAALATLEVGALAPRGPAVVIPLAAVPVSIGARPGLHGVRIDAVGRTSLDDAWVEP